jgi:hypothetical protein
VKHLLKYALFMAVFALITIVPTLAQASSPAAYLPAGTSVYVEVRVDENLDANLQRLVQVAGTLRGGSGSAASGFTIDQILQKVFPNLSFERDILPWVGSRAAIGEFPPRSTI